MTPLALGLAALLPTMLGTLTAPPEKTLTMHLCNGGTITILLGEKRPAQDRNCHPKGCHVGTCREKDEVKHPKRSN